MAFMLVLILVFVLTHTECIRTFLTNASYQKSDSKIIGSIGRGNGGAIGLQPHLILKVVHRILITIYRNIFDSIN